MKVLRLKALDGSEWAVPFCLVIDSYARALHKLADFAHDEWADVREYAEKRLHDDAATEWARDGMQWADVRDQAVRIKTADPVDMQDSWIEGKLEVIEWPIARDVWLAAADANAAWPFPKGAA